jgi:hypothetical protein
MLQIVSTLCFLIAGLINFAPIVGVLSTDRMQDLYGITIEYPDLAILMRHRAILFGIVGGIMLAAVVQPSLRPLALLIGLASMLPFMALVFSIPDAGEKLHRIAVIDLVATILLVAGASIEYFSVRA